MPAVEIAPGTIPLVASLFIHGAGVFLVMRAFERHGVPICRSGGAGQAFFGAMVGIALSTHPVEMLVRAATLVVAGAIAAYRDAFYYVAGTCTTPGYGEGTLAKE